jgi:hypothetical protein
MASLLVPAAGDDGGVSRALAGTRIHTLAALDQHRPGWGFYTDAAGVQHGFVRNPYGTITSFDPPEGNETNPTSISDGVAIVRGAGLRLALSAYRSGLAENFQPAE